MGMAGEPFDRHTLMAKKKKQNWKICQCPDQPIRDTCEQNNQAENFVVQ
jgi:hypothetical protein